VSGNTSVVAYKTCNEFPNYLEQGFELPEPLPVCGQLVFPLWMKSIDKICFHVAANTESEFIAGFVSGDTSFTKSEG
jgi:hypothetical protein